MWPLAASLFQNWVFSHRKWSRDCLWFMNKEGRIPGPTEENMDGVGNTQVSWHDTGLHMLHILSQRRAGLITSKCKHYDLFSNIRELIFYKLPKKSMTYQHNYLAGIHATFISFRQSSVSLLKLAKVPTLLLLLFHPGSVSKLLRV